LSDAEPDVTDVVRFGWGWENAGKARGVVFQCRLESREALAHLHSQHGEVTARKLVASELRKARRARCRKRFIFWESVAAQLAEQS